MKKIILRFLLIVTCVVSTSFTEPVKDYKYEQDITEIRSYLDEAKHNLEQAKKIEIDTIN